MGRRRMSPDAERAAKAAKASATIQSLAAEVVASETEKLVTEIRQRREVQVVSFWNPKVIERPPFPDTIVQGSEQFHDYVLANLQRPLAWAYRSARMEVPSFVMDLGKMTYGEAWFDWYKHNWKEFFRDCIWITDKTKQKIRLDVDDWRYKEAQNLYLDLMLQQLKTSGRIRIILLKCRQWGGTTLTKAAEVALCLFWPNSAELTVADDNDKSTNILQMFTYMLEDLPAWLKPKLHNSARDHIRFNGFLNMELETRSELWVATANNVKIGRSLTLTLIHGSECAFWGKNSSEVLLGLRNALADTYGSLFVQESTANGWGGEFFDEWRRAVDGESTMVPLFIPTSMIAEYCMQPNDRRLYSIGMDEEDRLKWDAAAAAGDVSGLNLSQEELELWEKHKCSGSFLLWARFAVRDKCAGNWQKFRQEYPLTADEAFISTGSPAFNPTILQNQMVANANTQYWDGTVTFDMDGKARWDTIGNGPIRLFEHPVPGHEYIVSADPSSGSELYVDYVKEGDNSAIVVRDRHARKVVARHVGRTAPYDMAMMVWGLVKYYNEAWSVTENNSGWGQPIIEYLRDKGYGKQYMRRIQDSVTNQVIFQYGWTTTRSSRPAAFSTARAQLSSGKELLTDTLLIGELMSMINRPLTSGEVRPEAKPGAKDDVALAWVIGVRCDYELGPVQEVVSETSRVLNDNHPNYWVWKQLEDETRERIQRHEEEQFQSFW
jgi:hypothetical protein